MQIKEALARRDELQSQIARLCGGFCGVFQTYTTKTMSHPAGDWYQYPDGPDYDEPTFTGRCPRCYAFVKTEPEIGREWRVVYEERTWKNPETGYEEWGQVEREMTAEEVASGKRPDRVYGGDPHWPCAKCGHEAEVDEMYQ
jgi:hypothetical protein